MFTGYDPQTGEVKKQFSPDVETYWFHHRCYRGKATEKYLLMSRTGIEFLDIAKESWMIHHWVRGACLYGIMPCNGLIYAPQHPCACYPETKLYGFNAVAPAAPTRPRPGKVSDEGRLQRGPAYAGVASRGSGAAAADEWPTYRHDATRSGSTKTKCSTDLKPAREAELGGRLRQRYFESLVGREMQVLAETPIADQPGMLLGTSGRYAPVELPGGNHCIGRLVRVTAGGFFGGRIRVAPR